MLHDHVGHTVSRHDLGLQHILPSCSTAYDVVVKDSPWQAEYFSTSGPMEETVGRCHL